jgi:hypothetical protein
MPRLAIEVMEQMIEQVIRKPLNMTHLKGMTGTMTGMTGAISSCHSYQLGITKE